MTVKQKLLDELFPAEGGGQLRSLKFLPHDLTITEEELCAEFLAAREEHRREVALKTTKLGIQKHPR